VPDAPPDAGAGDGATADGGVNTVIGTAGGMLSGAGAEVVVPAGALAEDQMVSIAAAASGYPPLPVGAVLLSSVLAFEPHGQLFTKPVTVSIGFTARSGATPQLITAAPGGSWASVAGAIMSGASMQALVAHFSFFAVIGLGIDGGSDGTTGTGGAGGCTSPQTQFGLIAQGDSNPGFTSSVGVRTATQFLVFSGYNGPDPSADGGTSDGGGANVNLIYWQAFDPTTAKSVGPAQPLVLTDSTSVGYIYLDDVSIAPTGEIALLYTHIDSVHALASGLSVAFLAPTANAGSAGPQVQQNVQIESAQVGNPPLVNGPNQGQPHAIWSTLSNAFVFSWTYFPSLPQVRVRKFLANGSPAGGDTDTVPTNLDPSVCYGCASPQYESGSVGTSGPLFGVAYLNGIRPRLTLLDAQGNEVGTSLQLALAQAGLAAGSASYYWVATAGTAQGFVYFSGTLPVSEFFVPTTPDGGVAAVADGGIAMLDGGAPLAGFSLTGNQGAVIGRAISDDTGGAGGVGAVLLYTDGAHFIYVNADGVTHVGPTTVISHAFGGGDEVAVTEFGGSFGVSLYSNAEHLTRMAASGCVH
jgi:hypothetical protein